MSEVVKPDCVEVGIKPDVTFIFPDNNGASLFTEKLKLADKSEVFEKQFTFNLGTEGEASRPPDRIIVTDISFEIFSALIGHIYGNMVNVTEENFMELLYASRKYFIDDLTYMVVKFLLKFLNPINLAAHYEFIEKFEIKMLNDHVKVICQEQPLQIIETLTNSVCHKKILKTILKSPQLPCSEYSLYRAVIAMLNRTLTNVPKSNENFRKELGKLIYLIRFPAMRLEELVRCGHKPSLLTTQQLIDIQLWVQDEKFSDTMLSFSTVPRSNPTSEELKKLKQNKQKEIELFLDYDSQ